MSFESKSQCHDGVFAEWGLIFVFIAIKESADAAARAGAFVAGIELVLYCSQFPDEGTQNEDG